MAKMEEKRGVAVYVHERTKLKATSIQNEIAKMIIEVDFGSKQKPTFCVVYRPQRQKVNFFSRVLGSTSSYGEFYTLQCYWEDFQY